MKILHVFRDDKFFDLITPSFDSIKGIENLYIFYTQNPNYKFKYIRSYHKILIETDEKKYLKLFSSNEFEAFFFHSLPDSFYRYILKTDPKKVIIWWSWGYDIYFSGLININLYKPLTLEVRNKNTDKTANSRTIIKSLINNGLRHLSSLKKNSIQRKVLSKISYCVTVLPIEFELLSRNRHFVAERFMERGVFRDLDVNILAKNPPLKGNILLGNSATYENNHLDVVKKLNQVFIDEDRKIIVPLNYGVNKYAEQIKQSFSSQYIHLDTFLKFEEYEKIIDLCSHAIFGTLRQQALGNINLCMFKGIKVFLYKDSLTYTQLKDDGYIVYSIEEDLNEKELSEPLSMEQMKHNHKILEQIYSKNGINALQKAFDKIKTNLP